MSDQNNSGVSNSAAFLAGLVCLIADGIMFRTVKYSYLEGTEAGNRALFALITGFEANPYPVLQNCLIPWLREQLVFIPAERATDSEIRADGETLRSAFSDYGNSERAALRLVKK